MDERIVRAGALASEALEFGVSRIKEGENVGDVIDAIASFVEERDAIVAFPPQISIDGFAAHDTARIDDERTLSGVVKLDVGVSVDGFIGDNAFTIDLTGNYADLLAACRKALDDALALAAPGVAVDALASVIESAIRGAGFEPIANLSGHGLSQYEIHTAPNVPNVSGATSAVLEPGMHVAIEPFATTGFGRIRDSGDPEVFRQASRRSVRDPIARRALTLISARKGLPFSARWLAQHIGDTRAKHAINALMQGRVLVSYAPLREVQDGIVAQFERTIYVEDDRVVITTPWSL